MNDTDNRMAGTLVKDIRSYVLVRAFLCLLKPGTSSCKEEHKGIVRLESRVLRPSTIDADMRDAFHLKPVGDGPDHIAPSLPGQHQAHVRLRKRVVTNACGPYANAVVVK